MIALVMAHNAQHAQRAAAHGQRERTHGSVLSDGRARRAQHRFAIYRGGVVIVSRKTRFCRVA